MGLTQDMIDRNIARLVASLPLAKSMEPDIHELVRRWLRDSFGVVPDVVMIQCQNCLGSGQVKPRSRGFHRWHTCRVCHGDGKVDANNPE